MRPLRAPGPKTGRPQDDGRGNPSEALAIIKLIDILSVKPASGPACRLGYSLDAPSRMTSRIARLGLLALAALVAAPTFATPSPAAGRIVGIVTDAQTGDPLLGASARIAGTSIGAATGMDGRFSIPSAPSGPQRLIVSYVGYVSDTLAVDVPDGGTVEVAAALSFLTLEGVEVTAQVAGQLSAINEQFRSATVVNVVSADRIQELPDNNAAESIGRLPGVAIQRSGGEANKVAIRGLSPKFNNVTVNGVRLAGTDGGDRSVDLSLVSSNILDGIEVRKAITPDMDADAVGGTINLRLRSAPSDLSVDVLAQGGYTGLQDSYDNYKVVGTVSDRFFGDRLGIIGTFNADRNDRSADKLGVGYAQTSLSDGDQETVLVPSSFDTREETVGRSRAGGSLLMDVRIPGGRVTGNTFYNAVGNEGLVRNRQANTTNLTYNVSTFDGTTSLWTSALGLEQDLGWLRYDLGGNYSRSRNENPEDLSFTFALDGIEGLRTIPTLDRYRLGLTLDQYETEEIVTDSTLELASLWADTRNLSEDQSGVQLNLQAPFRLGSWLTGYVKTGGKLRWLERDYDRDRYGRQGLQYPNPNLFECLGQALPQYQEDFVGEDFRINDVLLDYARGEDFLDGEFSLGLVPDDEVLLQVMRALQSDVCADPGDTPYATEFVGQYHPDTISSLGDDYSGTERYQAGYVMAELRIGDVVTVLPGVRYERDQTTYTGQRFRTVTNGQVFGPPADFEELTVERDFGYWLPMLHVDVRPLDWLSLRLARTRTLARPNYNQYAPITRIDQFNSTVVAANSTLRPSPATNYDASLQVVRGDIGLVGVSAFHKTIDDLVIGIGVPISSTLPPPEGTNIPEGWYESYRPTVYTNVNSPEPTTFYGYELEWQTNFSYLPGALKGLVLNLNYTRSFSETTYFSYELLTERVCNPRCSQTFSIRDTTRTGRMPDQAAHIANVTLGYDYKGFSTRLSYLFQSNTTASVSNSNALFDQFVGDYARVDLSVRQAVRAGFEVFANLNNLNNRRDQRYTNQNSVTGDYLFGDPSLAYRELYGFTVDVGARYRF